MSQSTVSLVLSGKGRGRISARTEAVVRAAAEELGYRPNAAARALRTGAARTVGLVVPDVTNPFFGRMLRGAQIAARRADYAVALADAGRDREWGAESAVALHNAAADGLLLFEVQPVGDVGPAVVIEGDPGEWPVVRLDVEAGMRAVASHLLELGHRRIAHLRSGYESSTFRRRRAALTEVLADGGAELVAHASAPEFTFRAAAVPAAALLESRATAILCDDDILAGGVYLAARSRGVAIGSDIAVAGFDDLDFAEVLAPPLTTVAADPEALGARAFEALAAVLAGEDVPEEQILPVRLVARESTAPPRRA